MRTTTAMQATFAECVGPLTRKRVKARSICSPTSTMDVPTDSSRGVSSRGANHILTCGMADDGLAALEQLTKEFALTFKDIKNSKALDSSPLHNYSVDEI